MDKVAWLCIFVILYWGYCIYWGIRGAVVSRTASDYFIAGRNVPLLVFALAATAASFTGWTLMGHPGLIYRDGLQYAYASFCAITVPFAGVLFLKRQWILGKRFGFVTPGEMFGTYFQGNAIRLLTVAVALCFAIPYLALQLRASGFLFNVLTDGRLPVDTGMCLLAAAMLIYVGLGGLRTVAYVDMLQCVLLIFGIVVIGIITLSNVGGWDRLTNGIAALAQNDTNLTPDGYSHYVAVPGVIQFVPDGQSATGGAWTGVMILTYMLALMGIQASPAFSMLAFASRSPRPFAAQQVWVSALVIGFILFILAAAQGMGVHMLGADLVFSEKFPELTNNVLGPALESRDLMDTPGRQGMLVPYVILLMEDIAPWLIGLLAVCALAAMQSTGSASVATAGMLSRDVLKHFFMPNASDTAQKLWGRIGVAAIIGAALVVAMSSSDALVLLGGVAVAFGFQMCVPLMAVCYFPWLTRQGVSAGLFLGIVAVVCTESIGQSWFGITAWGRWPLTLHSAFWGILFNLGAAVLVSALTQSSHALKHKMNFHNLLETHAGLPPEKQRLVPTAWIMTMVWFFFGVGPGCVIGNWMFGDPNGGAAAWTFGIPSIWAWQILWWVLGVFMMWFLAYKVEMSTAPRQEVEPLAEDVAEHPAS